MQPSWSPEDRRRALALADRFGLAQASADTGIPEGTIKSWRHRLARAAIASAEVVQSDAGRPWDERRDRVVIDFADTLDLARSQLHAALEVGTTKAARDLVIVVGVLADKCELFSGGATSRQESLSIQVDTKRTIDQLLDELGAKRRRPPGSEGQSETVGQMLAVEKRNDRASHVPHRLDPFAM